MISKSSVHLNKRDYPNYGSTIKEVSNEDKFKVQKEEQKLCELKIRSIIKSIFLLLSIGFFLWVVYYQVFVQKSNIGTTLCNGFGFLIIIYGLFASCIIYNYLVGPFLVPLIEFYIWTPVEVLFRKSRYAALTFYVLFFSGIFLFLIYDTKGDRLRLISLLGISFFLLLGYIFSPFKSHIKWTTVINGMVLQFSLALLIIKWAPGGALFNCVGNKVTAFLGYSVQGAAFVYGDVSVYQQGVLAFKTLSAVYYLGFCINILYYYGLMQKFVASLGRLLMFWFGTSICESVNSAANIFLSMTEAPLLLKPFLDHLTDSELHNIMTCGFATTSGTVLATFISYGADATTLITASVMSAPSALVYSKLMYPEKEEPEITQDNVNITYIPYDSLLEAAITGALDGVKMVLHIIAGIIACLSFVYFLNGVLTWMGALVGYTTADDAWTINAFAGKLFIPIAFLLGVPIEDCEKVGQLIGIKTMVNEFVAFQTMSTMNLQPKSKTIVTFVLCGFANPSAIGIMISGLTALVPRKRAQITRLVFRAAISGAIVSCMTACIAGVLIPTNQKTQ
ncbi:hypothetical protein WA026_005233 [Henosepilachna vigintioctopunctata]|uniref:Sodium/nucleoside cotransporter n=1 Tax=Henosepilachna vigintioctopunctata TaxID=420089 RepID=A0AAW1UWU1_9CUCU